MQEGKGRRGREIVGGGEEGKGDSGEGRRGRETVGEERRGKGDSRGGEEERGEGRERGEGETRGRGCKATFCYIWGSILLQSG